MRVRGVSRFRQNGFWIFFHRSKTISFTCAHQQRFVIPSHEINCRNVCSSKLFTQDQKMRSWRPTRIYCRAWAERKTLSSKNGKPRFATIEFTLSPAHTNTHLVLHFFFLYLGLVNLRLQSILDFAFRRSEHRGARPVLRQIVTFQTFPPLFTWFVRRVQLGNNVISNRNVRVQANVFPFLYVRLIRPFRRHSSGTR